MFLAVRIGCAVFAFACVTVMARLRLVCLLRMEVHAYVSAHFVLHVVSLQLFTLYNDVFPEIHNLVSSLSTSKVACFMWLNSLHFTARCAGFSRFAA